MHTSGFQEERCLNPAVLLSYDIFCNDSVVNICSQFEDLPFLLKQKVVSCK